MRDFQQHAYIIMFVQYFVHPEELKCFFTKRILYMHMHICFKNKGAFRGVDYSSTA